VRRFVSIPVSVVFALAFARAPFEHVHDHEAEDHPHGGFFHSHLPQMRTGTGIAWQDYDPDEDARPLNWFHPVSSPGLEFVAVLVPVAEVVLTPADRQTIEPVEPRGHDPPPTGPSAPRSPPV
jgi:hypothetical protein